MATSVNKIILLGHIGNPPEVRSNQYGNKIAKFDIATTDWWQEKSSGDWKSRTEWNRVVVYNERLISMVERRLDRGSKVLVEGQLRTRSWTDNNGATRYVKEVVLDRFNGEIVLTSGGREDADGPPQDTARSPGATPYSGQSMSDVAAARTGAGTAPALNDEIPF